MAVRVAANGVPCFRELEKSIAPVSRHIRKLVDDTRRGREKGGRELQRVEHRKSVFELLSITVIERQQHGGVGGQRSAVQPFRELLHCKDGIPVFGQSFHLGMKALAASDSMVAEDENVCSSEGSR
jgi:hypothetical protein